MAAKRVVCLIAAAVVTAEGVCPDVVFGVFHHQFIRYIVWVGNHVLAVQPITTEVVGSIVTLELNVLEVIRTFVVELVLHPEDCSFASFGNFSY